MSRNAAKKTKVAAVSALACPREVVTRSSSWGIRDQHSAVAVGCVPHGKAIPASIAESPTQRLIALTEIANVDHVAADAPVGRDLVRREERCVGPGRLGVQALQVHAQLRSHADGIELL